MRTALLRIRYQDWTRWAICPDYGITEEDSLFVRVAAGDTVWPLRYRPESVIEPFDFHIVWVNANRVKLAVPHSLARDGRSKLPLSRQDTAFVTVSEELQLHTPTNDGGTIFALRVLKSLPPGAELGVPTSRRARPELHPGDRYPSVVERTDPAMPAGYAGPLGDVSVEVWVGRDGLP